MKKVSFKNIIYIYLPILIIVLTIFLPLLKVEDTTMFGFSILMGIRKIYTSSATHFLIILLPLSVILFYKAIKEQPIKEVFSFLAYGGGLIYFLFLPFSVDKKLLIISESDVLFSTYIILLLYFIGIVLTVIDTIKVINQLKKNLALDDKTKKELE